jgi:nucleotide-binding universal stress UspA family protein
MFERIVVGVDGREGGRDALALAAMLQGAGGGDVTAVHVYLYDQSVPLDDAEAFERQLQESLMATLEREIAEAHVSARPVVVSGTSPARALHAAADREHADLIVVGSCHRAGTARVFVGDDAAETLHDSPCAVALAPRGYAAGAHELRLIGVGYDASHEAHSALRVAADLARHANAYVRATAVVAPAAPLFPGDAFRDELPITDRTSRETAEAALAHAALGFGDHVTTELAVGSSWRALADRSGDLDLLVVGSRGYGPLRRVFLGSTSTHLFREAACPVLVLPRAARTPTDLPSFAPVVGTGSDR